jgi:hypothetical protein
MRFFNRALIPVFSIAAALLSTSASAQSTWTYNASGSTAVLNDVVWVGTQFVAVAEQGRIITSPDGTTWTAQVSGTSYDVSGIVWTGSQFVTIGTLATVRTSPDAVTWTSRTSGSSTNMHDLVWSGTTLVAVGNNGTILTSPNGTTWTSRTSNTTQSLYAIAWNGTIFAAVGDLGTIRTAGSSASAWSSPTVTGSPTLTVITAANGLFVAAGYAGKIYTSTDGVTWTARTSGTTNAIHGLDYIGGRFVASAGPTILLSVDGITWTSSTGPELMYAFAANTTTVVAVGMAGQTYVSPLLAPPVSLRQAPKAARTQLVYGTTPFNFTVEKGLQNGQPRTLNLKGATVP